MMPSFFFCRFQCLSEISATRVSPPDAEKEGHAIPQARGVDTCMPQLQDFSLGDAGSTAQS